MVCALDPYYRSDSYTWVDAARKQAGIAAQRALGEGLAPPRGRETGVIHGDSLRRGSYRAGGSGKMTVGGSIIGHSRLERTNSTS